MLRYLAKPEPDMVTWLNPTSGAQATGLGRCCPVTPLPALALPIRSPAFPRLPLLHSGKRGKGQGHFAPLVMEVRRGTGCSQVQIITVIIVVNTMS